jgi:hypothetical protein
MKIYFGHANTSMASFGCLCQGIRYMKASRYISGLVATKTLLLTIAISIPVSALAEVTCVRATNKASGGKIATSLSSVTRTAKCKKGEVAALTGAAGPAGTDGQLRIYGNGSDGSMVVTTNQTLSDAAPMYTDVVINSGVTWTVPSGTVIRCSGTFQNNGTIAVQTGAPGGEVAGVDTAALAVVYSPPHPGVSARAASSGEFGDGTNSLSGGRPGFGLSLFQASMLRYPGPFAGGGGAG